MFIICAVIYAVGGCVSVALLDAKLQPWANISHDPMKGTFASKDKFEFVDSSKIEATKLDRNGGNRNLSFVDDDNKQQTINI